VNVDCASATEVVIAPNLLEKLCSCEDATRVLCQVFEKFKLFKGEIKGCSLDLTFKEFELLKYLAQHPGRVFTRARLLQEIWGYDYFGGTRTVDVHIRRLRSKLGPEFESIIGTVRNVGYRFTVQNGGKETNSLELV